MRDFQVYGFDEKIKALRIKHKFTQQEVADKIGVTKSTINRYENDNMPPSLDSAIKLAILFNVTIDYLVGLDKESFLYLFNFSEKQQAHILHALEILDNDFFEEPPK